MPRPLPQPQHPSGLIIAAVLQQQARLGAAGAKPRISAGQRPADLPVQRRDKLQRAGEVQRRHGVINRGQMLVPQGDHPPDRELHPLPGGRLPFHLAVQQAGLHIQPPPEAVHPPAVQPEGMPFNLQADNPCVGHIQHRLVHFRQPVGALRIYNRLRVVESVQIIAGHCGAGRSVIALLEVAAHPDIAVAEREHALAALIKLLLIRILAQAPFPVRVQCRRMLIRLHLHDSPSPPFAVSLSRSRPSAL
ncbi:hypothetical protein D3C75_537390 [compost metagenome]